MPDKLPKGFIPDPPAAPAGFVPDSGIPDAAVQARQKILSMAAGMQSEISPMEEAIGSGGAGGLGFRPNRTPEEKQQITSSLVKNAAVTGGTLAAPALLPEMAGGGILGFVGRILTKAGLSGVGAGAGNITSQVLAGDDPLSREHLIETGKIAGFTSALAVPFESLGALAATKAGRGAINASLGASSRDLTYANPARALLREEIHDIGTGDWEAYQSALRAGKAPSEAAQSAGGRFAAVSQRINELTPRLGKLLNESTAKIPVANVIDKPLEDAAIEIIQNNAMTDPEKMAAIGKLGDLQKSLKEGLIKTSPIGSPAYNQINSWAQRAASGDQVALNSLKSLSEQTIDIEDANFAGQKLRALGIPTQAGDYATPAQLQTIKQGVGNRVNWGGTSAITDDVKAAYRSVYGSLKEAIHRSVPGSAEIDNRLTDLLGASRDLVSQAKAEEGGKIPFSAVRVGQREVGRILPATTNAPAVIPVGASIGQQLIAKGKGLPQAPPNTPGVPFHPNQGQP
jgi:hypothetical protein